ncbi:flavonol synthase/flavanone 3-hydroxylase [Cucurbitaria berberidis CBS 394.84]|uniref:Flavonol synthase/flavanone 3-hydroxylase n=1 Tax=Cucurbitaria berberidis CBS 394.84 TaxID=1168544 RepID=A0A9P4GMU7_9PLEO|nr:flavonol synthase/flavanone 3-hydroxylase [Cucurbitaria berberidis CBS 394.84]KAF1848097.1 flavonol synthase/flavanone 3-hydroxylase [Cucurbitaria berberidis CBS 394.84]
MTTGTDDAPSLPDATTHDEAHNGAAAYLQSRLAVRNDITDADFDVPVIDISPSFSSSLENRQAVAAQIQKACTTSGFFYITGHRVPENARKAILRQAERFMHELNTGQKEELHVKNSKFGLGWEPSDYTSIAGDQEQKEVFNFAYEEALDPTGGDGLYRNLDGTKYKGNLWPKEQDLPGFYDAVKEYYGAVLDLARHLFRLFALSLNLPETYFDSMTTHPGGIARLLYYPPPKNPQPVGPSSEEQIGLGAHSDYECFTLLLTSSTPGLEILKPSGQWHIATFIPDSFIVNVADFLMRWTNGLYLSTVHRVVNRGTEARYSVPFFFSVNYDTVIQTLPTCLKEGEKSVWKPIEAGEYILERLNATTQYGLGFQEQGVESSQQTRQLNQ